MHASVTTDRWKTFELTPVRERFRAKSPYGRYADALETETRRYLYLAANGGARVAPSDIVDEFWHAMILNTELYRSYCTEAFGRIIDHDAGVPATDDAAAEHHQKTYVATLDLYRRTFGAPDPQYWPDPRDVVKDSLAMYAQPHRIHIETTNHCNLACEHCYPSSSVKEPHHDVEVINKVLDEAKRKKVRKVTLTGGELLTRPDWKDVVRRSLDTTDNLYFITNGILLDEEKLQWLAREKAIRSLKNIGKTLLKRQPVEIGLAISLDGLEGNKLVRKNSAGKPIAAEKLIEKIKLAIDYGLHVTVNTTITNDLTARELPAMYDIMSTIGIDRWQIDQVCMNGRMRESELGRDGLSWLELAKPGFKYIMQNYLKDYPKIPKWRLEIVQVFRYDMLFYGFYPSQSLDEHPCKYHFGSVIVEGGDQVRFCPSLRVEPLGRISETGSLDATYNQSEEFKDFLKKSINDLPCKSCRYGRLFHGGCRANSYAFSGKMWDRDPICCSLSPFVEDEIVPLLPKQLQASFMAALQGGPRPGDPEHPTTQEWAQPRKHFLPVLA